MGPFLLPLLVLANVLGVGMIVPQAVRLGRTRTVDGVSATWVGGSMAMNLWWLGYGLESQLWGLIPVSSGALVVYGIIALQLRLLAGPNTVLPLLASIGSVSAVLVTILATSGWPSVGLALGLAYGLQFAPAAAKVLQPGPHAGVAPSTWLMAVTEAAIWVVYGLAVADRALILGGMGGTVMATIILVRLATDSGGRPISPLATG